MWDKYGYGLGSCASPNNENMRFNDKNNVLKVFFDIPDNAVNVRFIPDNDINLVISIFFSSLLGT